MALQERRVHDRKIEPKTRCINQGLVDDSRSLFQLNRARANYFFRLTSRIFPSLDITNSVRILRTTIKH